MNLRGALAALVLCGAVHAALAQETLEIIPLRHRSVEEVLPVLRPLLEPGAALSGQKGQLFLRATPANVAQMRRALEAIDRPLRRLEVSVRFDTSGERQRQSVDVRGTLGSRQELEVRASDRHGRRDERVDQRLQVMEGGRAYIASGQSRPYPEREVIHTPGGTVVRETTVMHDTGTGFYIVPRLAGERVQLDIVADGVATQTSARLGEWLEIAGATESRARETGGLARAGRSQAFESRRVWVRVEERDH
jgi:type II secretory pathway component GspD/PulD (secretin)